MAFDRSLIFYKLLIFIKWWHTDGMTSLMKITSWQKGYNVWSAFNKVWLLPVGDWAVIRLKCSHFGGLNSCMSSVIPLKSQPFRMRSISCINWLCTCEFSCKSCVHSNSQKRQQECDTTVVEATITFGSNAYLYTFVIPNSFSLRHTFIDDTLILPHSKCLWRSWGTTWICLLRYRRDLCPLGLRIASYCGRGTLSLQRALDGRHLE